MRSISLIVPCYNEELNIQKGVLDRIGNYTSHLSRVQEVIISDDGSSDKSRSIIKTEYLPEFSKFKLLENAHRGKAHTLISAIQQAKGDYVIFTDFDLATPIEELHKMIEKIDEGYDIIIGSRNNDRQGAPFTRKIMALGFILIRNFMIGLHSIRDTQCGFKAFHRQKACTIIDKLRVFKRATQATGSSVSAGFDLEFLFLATKLQYKIKEIPVIWKHVETKNVNFIHDSIETLKDIARIKYYDLTHAYDHP